MEEKSKALAKAILDYVEEASTDESKRRALLEHMSPQDQAAYELLREWLDPEDEGVGKSPSRGGLPGQKS